MRLTKLVLGCSTLLVILSYTAGCSARAPGLPGDDPPPSGDAGPAVPIDAPPADAMPGSPDTGGPALDTSADTGSPDHPGDAARPQETGTGAMPDVPEPLLEPTAFLLAPTTCSGRRLGRTTPGLDLGAGGARLWHLCYKTPSAATSGHPLARQRARSVAVLRGDGFEGRELVRAEAPATANPWTVSVLVALPADDSPTFNFRNAYESGSLAAVTTALDGRFPETHGEIQAWSVAPDGTQMPAAPERACRDAVDFNGPMPFFVPQNGCTGPGVDCRFLDGMDCRAIPRP